MQHKILPHSLQISPFSLLSFRLDKTLKGALLITNEQRIQQLEKSYRKCPHVLHGPGCRTPDPYAQERISALIRQGKPTAYTYRGKRLISKIDLLEFLGATDKPAIWAGKIKPGGNKGKEKNKTSD